MYRFRSIDSLIGREELEKQQIYFSALDQLNDPLEGTRRYFWRGDLIVWTNFLRHFVLCLEHAVLLCSLTEPDQTFSHGDIPIYLSDKILPTEDYRKRIRKINDRFFSEKFVQAYLQFFVSRSEKIYMEELYIHLKFILQAALKAISDQNVESGIPPIMSRTLADHEALFDAWNKLESHSKLQVHADDIRETLHNVMKQLDAQLHQEFKEPPKFRSLYVDFPQMYLDSVTKLTYPDAYVACFMDDCSNSAVWGTYAQNHTGVCLKFKDNPGLSPTIPLKVAIGHGTGGYVYDFREFTFHPIEYSSDFDELDFFRNIGRLPIGQLHEQWYTDKNGDLSVCAEDLFSHEDEWRSQYWSRYQRAFLRKLPDWSHEREHRLILSSMLGLYDDKKNRLVEYKFEYLEAIVFGMKTPEDIRNQIIEIIQRKCEETGRTQFDFFEMVYSSAKKSILSTQNNAILVSKQPWSGICIRLRTDKLRIEHLSVNFYGSLIAVTRRMFNKAVLVYCQI